MVEISLVNRVVISYLKLARLDKPWGLVLLAWPTYSALWLADVEDLKTWCVFTLGVLFTRSAGCVINDYADQWLDGQVLRTQDRPLIRGDIGGREALVFFGFWMVLAGLLLPFLESSAQYLAMISSGLLVLYPYVKRFWVAPQAFLGIVFSMGIPMSYLQAKQPLDTQFWGFYGLVVFWVMLYDTIYAMGDKSEDAKTGVHSMALWLGKYDVTFIEYGYGVLWVLWALWGWSLGLGFYLGWIGLGVNYYRQIQCVRKEEYFSAFLLNQYGGLWVLLGIMLS